MVSQGNYKTRELSDLPLNPVLYVEHVLGQQQVIPNNCNKDSYPGRLVTSLVESADSTKSRLVTCIWAEKMADSVQAFRQTMVLFFFSIATVVAAYLWPLPVCILRYPIQMLVPSTSRFVACTSL